MDQSMIVAVQVLKNITLNFNYIRHISHLLLK